MLDARKSTESMLTYAVIQQLTERAVKKINKDVDLSKLSPMVFSSIVKKLSAKKA